MLYPAFLKKGDTIGITAPSCGIGGAYEPAFDASLDRLRHLGYQVTQTASVRCGGLASASGERRAKELAQLLENDHVQMILCAAGGDFLIDMLPYVDFSLFRKHPKWLQGYSDPTGLLFPVTVNEDVATLYGPTAGEFSMRQLHPALQYNLALWRGKTGVQESFEQFTRKPVDPILGYEMTDDVCWLDVNGPVHVRGRMIGGCIECLQLFVGTPYADVAAFNRRYANDGVLWYFDIFSMRAEQLYQALWQMREAGWFSEAVGFLFGRVCFPNSELGMSYADAVQRALGCEVPILLDVDIGHVQPSMTIINGALAEVTGHDGSGTLRFELG